MIDVKDTISLSDGNEYAVVSKINYEGFTYFALVDMESNTNIKIVKEIEHEGNLSVEEITKNEILEKIIPLLFEESKKLVEEMLDDELK